VPSHSKRNRYLASAALLLLGLTVTVVVATIVQQPKAFFFGLLGLPLMLGGAWWAITERDMRRAFGGATGALGLFIVLGGMSNLMHDFELFLIVGLLAAAALCARLAVAETLHAIDLVGALPSWRPARPVLICNPRSGGGKVEQFDLPGLARAVGVDVVVLDDGMDLEQVARDAVARGADCLGMAGGDGSQALVASVAIEAGLPFVCISAGTRNHFAADLGLDRNNPAQGLSAFTDGVLFDVDYGLAGRRLFVNNVSLGVYASIVEQEGYREAKVETALQELPKVVGSNAEPYDLQFRRPGGELVDGPLLVLVSNNPYTVAPTLNLGKRRSLNEAVLGVISVGVDDGADPAQFVAGVLAGLVSDDPRVLRFTTQIIEITSRSGSVAAGIDGESVTLPTPLRMRIAPKGLRLLVPADTIEAVAHRRYRQFGVRGLWDIARGREPDLHQLLP